MESVVSESCPWCGRESESAARQCEECSTARRGAVVEALRGALGQAQDDAAGEAIAGALVHLGGAATVAEVREWLLARVPLSPYAGDLVAKLGRLPDAIARAEATRIAIENFREKRLTGRWDVVLAGLPTPAARATLIQAVLCGEEATVWAAVQAMLGAWEEVPHVAFPALRELLRSEEAPEPLRFCAAVLLTRGGDTETWAEARPWLMAALEAGSDADSMAAPTHAVVVLYGRGDAQERAQAEAYLLDRLLSATDGVLECALPPLLAQQSASLVRTLVAACRQRRVASPSAERLAAAFSGLREGAVAEQALAALLSALGPADACDCPREATLIAALGYLGHPGALPWLAARAAGAEDPAVHAAVAAAQARLGVPVAIARCAAFMMGEAQDAMAALSPDTSRAAAMADVLGAVWLPSAIPVVMSALLRALEDPARAPHAARALGVLWAAAPVPEVDGLALLASEGASSLSEIVSRPSTAGASRFGRLTRPQVDHAEHRALSIDHRCAAVPHRAPSTDLDRTREWRPEELLVPERLPVPAEAARVPEGYALVRADAALPAPVPAVDLAELLESGRLYGGASRTTARSDRRSEGSEVKKPDAPKPRRRRFFNPMGLQRFAGVAGALATCAIFGMGYMRWLVALPPLKQKPHVLATVIVITPGATVHSKKGLEHPVIKTTRRGDYLAVVDKTNRWWKVRFNNGLTGWIERRDTAVLIDEPDQAPTGTTPQEERDVNKPSVVASVFR